MFSFNRHLKRNLSATADLICDSWVSCVVTIFSILLSIIMNRRRKAGRKLSYPCGNCEKNCIDLCVACGTCGKWFHGKCQAITDKDLTKLAKSNAEYRFRHCTEDEKGHIFKNSLDRLGRTSTRGMDALLDAAAVESVIISRTDLPPMPKIGTHVSKKKIYIIFRLVKYFGFSVLSDTIDKVVLICILYCRSY